VKGGAHIAPLTAFLFFNKELRIGAQGPLVAFEPQLLISIQK
jgi:hypothetical protein